MTKPIDEMNSAELNEAVAVEVMGWHKINISTKIEYDSDYDVWVAADGHGGGAVSCWRPALLIQLAWVVLERMTNAFGISLLILPNYVCIEIVVSDQDGRFRAKVTVTADTAPLAICRAALKAVRESD